MREGGSKKRTVRILWKMLTLVILMTLEQITSKAALRNNERVCQSADTTTQRWRPLSNEVIGDRTQLSLTTATHLTTSVSYHTTRHIQRLSKLSLTSYWMHDRSFQTQKRVFQAITEAGTDSQTHNNREKIHAKARSLKPGRTES